MTLFRLPTVLIAVLLATLLSTTASGQSATQSTQDLRRLSLEALLQVEVETVSRVPEPVTNVPAAVYVITQDDIRRSGATSIPEALRLAPGVQVARINAGTWAIGMRGFADRLARSMLVLIDGRAVYSPLFAGTYWETQDTLLPDVERIEVIRGPGGTLWGANAVNGIINIITKSSKDTRGVLALGAAGSELRGLGGLRYGGTAGSWTYRLYGKGFDRDSEFHTTGTPFDGLTFGQGGFRADWSPLATETVTVQGDVYGARLGQRESLTSYTRPFTLVANREAPLSGGNVLARWGREAGSSQVQVQTFYARTNRDERPVRENRDTFDVDFQMRVGEWRRQQVTWGLGYRVTSGRITAAAPTDFFPPTRTDTLVSGFVQDEIALRPDTLRLTVGSKFEHNDYSGGEAQPGLRVLWKPAPIHTVWGAVTSAVRTPSRVETDYTTTSLVNPTPVFVRLMPDPAFGPERVLAYEAGFGTQPLAGIYVSVAGFYNRLDNVLSTEILPAFVEPAGSPERVIIPVTFANGLEGKSYGGEVTFDGRATTRWRWTANYSYLRIDMARKPGSRDGSQVVRNEGLSPRHQLQFRSSVDLDGGVSIDATGRAVSRLPVGPVPAYATIDLRVGWRLSSSLELAVVGQDLAESHHIEWNGPTGVGIQRSGYVELLWRR